jgi:LL-diaminopimelate aminotransferase
MQAQVARPDTHQYPSNRGRASFREAVAAFYDRRFGVDLDPDAEIIPAMGAKEAVANINLAFLDPGDVALASDPGYPVYTTGPILAGAEPVALPLVPGLGFEPDLEAIPADVLDRARIIYLNYPNNPTGAVVEGDLFDRVVALARRHDLIVVHDNAYSEITYDGYVAPSFLATPGAKDVGIEVFSLSKTYNMTGWRSGAVVGNRDLVQAYWQLKTNLDSGMFEALQEASAAALASDQASVREMCEVYARRRDTLVAALREIGLAVTPPKGAIYVWAPVPAGETSASFTEKVLEEAGSSSRRAPPTGRAARASCA